MKEKNLEDRDPIFGLRYAPIIEVMRYYASPSQLSQSFVVLSAFLNRRSRTREPASGLWDRGGGSQQRHCRNGKTGKPNKGCNFSVLVW